MAQPGAHQLGALLRILALMCDIKINFIRAIYKIILAAGNALWESPPLTPLNRISYRHCKTKHGAISRIQRSIFLLSISLRAYLEGMQKFPLNFPLAAASPALHAAGRCACDAAIPPLLARVHGLLQE